jgi:hypothetical protein
MSTLEIAVPVNAMSMADLRPALDAALQRQFPGGMLQRSWEGDVLRLAGPGASGAIVLENGQLVGRAELKPPASMMRGVIQDKVGAALREAAAATAA